VIVVPWRGLLVAEKGVVEVVIGSCVFSVGGIFFVVPGVERRCQCSSVADMLSGHRLWLKGCSLLVFQLRVGWVVADGGVLRVCWRYRSVVRGSGLVCLQCQLAYCYAVTFPVVWSFSSMLSSRESKISNVSELSISDAWCSCFSP
jgi:hypothetical protein